MFCRIMLAALWLGLVFATSEADARSSGGSGRGVSRASGPGRSLQRSPQAPARVFNRTTQGLNVTPHPRRGAFHRHFRNRYPFVFAAPYDYGGYGYGYGYGGDGYVPPTSYAESDSVPPGEPVVVNGRPCFVQPYIVPAEGTGTMRTVTVTRCY